jgi:hypothetical protein
VVIRSKARSTLLALGLGSLAATGCSWTTYDELQDDVWVDVSTGPETPNTDYPIALAVPGVRNATDPVARFAVLGRASPTLTSITYAADGKRTERPSQSLAETVSIESFSLKPAFAADPKGKLIGFAALTNDEDTHLVVFQPTDSGELSTQAVLLHKPVTRPNESPIPQYHPEGLAFAQLATFKGSTDVVDAVIGRDVDIATVLDPTGVRDPQKPDEGTFSCQHGGKWSYAVAVGDVLSTNPGPEIVISTGSQNRATPGAALRVFSLTAISAHTGVNNAAPPCGTPLQVFDVERPNDFGEEVLIADFGGDGRNEIIASAPQSNRVFIYAEDASKSLVEERIVFEGNDFGRSLAAGDLDGDGQPELVVGAPNANIAGESNAGAVYVFKYDAAAKKFGETPIAIFHDAQAENEQLFGSTVAVVPWGPDKNVLVAGSKSELFIYFRTKLYDEVRAER